MSAKLTRELTVELGLTSQQVHAHARVWGQGMCSWFRGFMCSCAHVFWVAASQVDGLARLQRECVPLTRTRAPLHAPLQTPLHTIS